VYLFLLGEFILHKSLSPTFTEGRLAGKSILFEQQVDKTILHREILIQDKKSDVVHIPCITHDTSGGLLIPFDLKILKFPCVSRV